MGEVEKYGTGYIRIRSWLHDYPKLEYEVENMGDFTRVYLRQKVVNGDKLGERLGDKLGDKLGDNQKLILEAIQNNPKISLSQLSSLIGISQTAVENNISKLKSFGLLKRTGSSKRGNWEVLL
jgi:ATP-dependent DNA helicase RecG